MVPERQHQALAEGAKRSRPSMVRGATGAAARVSPGQDLAKAGPLAFEGLPGGCPMWEVFPRKQMLCKSELMWCCPVFLESHEAHRVARCDRLLSSRWRWR